MKTMLRLIILTSLISVCACSSNEVQYAAIADSAVMDSKVAFTEPAIEKQEDASVNILPTDRKIVKEGEIRFETRSSKETYALISKVVAEAGGYISSDNASSYGDQTEYRITIRVPSDQFEALLDKISKSAAKLDSKDIHTLDVTEEFIDTEARVGTKKALEDRYKELLKRANSVEDVLAVEREIGTLRADIESMEGRLKYLKDRVSYSTLAVVFYEKGATATTGFGSEFVKGLKDGWDNLLWTVIGFVSLWPFLLIIAAAIIIVIRVIRKKRRRNRVQ